MKNIFLICFLLLTSACSLSEPTVYEDEFLFDPNTQAQTSSKDVLTDSELDALFAGTPHTSEEMAAKRFAASSFIRNLKPTSIVVVGAIHNKTNIKMLDFDGITKIFQTELRKNKNINLQDHNAKEFDYMCYITVRKKNTSEKNSLFIEIETVDFYGNLVNTWRY